MKEILMHKKYQGFTLIETVVSMFIFVLMIAATAQIFTQSFSGYRYEKSVQNDLESAQFAINTMAKELRTSSIASASSSSVKFIDYSQSTCFDYEITGTTLTVASQGGAEKVSDCGSYGSPTVVARGIVGGAFAVTESRSSGPQRIGRVTLSLQIGTGATHQANIQTSVSLRDYGNAGL